MNDALTPQCSLCDGSGMIMVERPDRTRAVRDCECRAQRRAARTRSRSQIPPRYEHCSLESFETSFNGATRSVHAALMTARKFVASYPLETRGTGLLLTGSIGVGKTHLAVGVLQALMEERGACGRFCHFHDLLTQVRNSYNREVNATELEVLRPIFEAEVLVLDELGASKPTDWVWDTVSQILNTRYNERRTTILTTNYVNSAPMGIGIEANALQRARAATREETLGDRIGERMRSRLQEMCVVVEMHGVDFRQTVNLARIG